VGKYDANFVSAGGTLPPDKDPSQEYSGNKFITCMPLLTHVEPGEDIRIKALIMGEADHPELHYRTLGDEEFKTIDMSHEARGVYRASIPGQEEDFEWYVTAGTNLGDVIFPATAGAIVAERNYQTVVVTTLSNCASEYTR
jgi:hypothetical protein